MTRFIRVALIGLAGLAAVAAVLFFLGRGSLTVMPPGERGSGVLSGDAARVAGQLTSGRVIYGDWWELAFTEPQYPDDPARGRGGLDERLVALMDQAQSTLDVAIYDFDLVNVAEAMVRAKQRGVRVRMVTDSDTIGRVRDDQTQAALALLGQAGIPIVADERDAIMHHKFTIVDGEWVETGSWNYTVGDTYRLNNNQFIARSPELAANFTAEFEKMFVQRAFGARKARGVPYPVITIGDSRVVTLFAPQDEVADRLLSAIKEARSSIGFLAFSFTHDRLGEAIVSQAREGLAVEGVFERTGSNTQYSEFGRMRQAGLEVYQDGSPWAMHHKVVVLDEQTVAFGSFNFSANADEGNDENLLLVQDARLAQAFQTELERMVALAKSPATPRTK